MTRYTSKLLNLENVIITNAENIEDQLYIILELSRAEHTSPACGATTDHIHDYRMQTINDVPLGVPSCTFVGTVIAAAVLSGSLRKNAQNKLSIRFRKYCK